MSTIARLDALVLSGDLHDWSSPLGEPTARLRRFIVTNEVKTELEKTPWAGGLFESDAQAEERRVRVHAMINQFVQGDNLTFGKLHQDADLKALKPMERVPDWRIFALRPWKSARLTRILGEFAAKDVFVALAIAPRQILGDWNKLMGRADATWLRLFPNYPPMTFEHAPTSADIGSNYDDL